MNTPQDQPSRRPFGLIAVASYFLLVGIISLLLPLLHSDPRYAEFEAKPPAYKLGASARSLTLDVLYVASGVGLFCRRHWARTLGLWVLAVGAFYGAYAFAWGFAHGRPALPTLAMSFTIVGGWTAIWFFLLYRSSWARSLR